MRVIGSLILTLVVLPVLWATPAEANPPVVTRPTTPTVPPAPAGVAAQASEAIYQIDNATVPTWLLLSLTESAFVAVIATFKVPDGDGTWLAVLGTRQGSALVGTFLLPQNLELAQVEDVAAVLETRHRVLRRLGCRGLGRGQRVGGEGVPRRGRRPDRRRAGRRSPR